MLHRSTGLTILLCAGIALFDFQARLWPETVSAEVKESDPNLDKVEVRFLTEEDAQKALQLLEEFDVVKQAQDKKEPVAVTKPKAYVMPEELQMQQRGKLDQLFDGVHKYVLRATFNNNGERFAVLEKQHLETQELDKVVLKAGQSLSGYKLSSMDTTSVSLQHGDRVVELQLFLKQPIQQK